MDHSQAIEQMAAERYLLNELSPEAREAFEEHFFDCPDCALDVRTAAVFVDEAKQQLPSLIPAQVASPVRPEARRRSWFSGWGSMLAVPAFAALMLVFGYQNLVTFPALRRQSMEPRIMAMASLHGATRGGPASTIQVDPKQGVALPIDLSQDTGSAPVASYEFALLDAQGKQVWSIDMAAGATTPSQNGSQRVSLAIPGGMLHDGQFSVTVTGVGAHGERTPVDQYALNVVLVH